MVANLAALDELRRDWRDQHVVAMRAANGCGEGTNGKAVRSISMKLHVTASFPVALTIGVSWRGRDPLMKLWWLEH
jgi:hypothetical protein